jgi:pyruvate-ferredoxin/flavodoxin oxidoreductase
VVRAKQIEPAKLKGAPDNFVTLESKTKNERDLRFRLQIYIEDCTGCANCINICPAKEKALEFRPIEEEREAGQNRNVDFFESLPDNILDGTKLNSLKGSQFRTPLFEFSGACAGCGETPYVKLLTQLFGERLVVANATGCSSIYGGTFPTIPYTTTKDGRGPTWANSLFEDNAEYGFGMRLAINAQRKQLKSNIDTLLNSGISSGLKSRLKTMLEHWEDTGDEGYQAARAVKEALQTERKTAGTEIRPVISKLIEMQDALIDRSVWCLGGDGWAYDIGYGGLDHVLAQNKNVNILVLDTEVYSNTGGQASKATPLGSVAQFAASGKRTTKKDLGLMCMSYGYIYVASISLAANPNQAIKAYIEAEAYDGPSIIIAYAPCIAHGVDMHHTYETQKNAVRSGYWPLYRFDPTNDTPFNYESRDPKMDMIDFLLNENRYRSLKRQSPEIAQKLFEQAKAHNMQRHRYYQKLSEIQKA